MSRSDVPPDEMDRDPNATDDALERMLSGQAPMTDEWRELAGFVDDLHEAVPARDLASEDMHVAAMVETSQSLRARWTPRNVPMAPAPTKQTFTTSGRRPAPRCRPSPGAGSP